MKSPDLLTQLTLADLPAPETEHRFAPPRRWRFDYCWPAHRLAFEIEGGAWVGGRHTRPRGFEADIEKYNAAALRGWLLLRATPAQVRSGQALAWIREALEQRKELP